MNSPAYPAQRNDLEPIFKDLIVQSDFPADRTYFLDEPTAAAYNTLTSEQWTRTRGAFGKGLILDVGAGTTDYTIADFRGGEIGVNVVDSSSTNMAGNNFTYALRALLQQSDDKAAFDRFVADAPWEADAIKEQISDWYKVPDNYNEPYNRLKKGVGRFSVANRKAFKDSVNTESQAILSRVMERLAAVNLSKDQLGFVLLVGGGGLHTGLADYIKDVFGTKAELIDQPQTGVSKGACLFAKSLCLGEQNRALLVRSTVPRVWIQFPEDTKQKDVLIFTDGQEIPVGRTLRGKERIVLQSNIFFKEGDMYLRMNDTWKNLGEINIKWFSSEEINDHGGYVEWEFQPQTGRLSVVVKLDKTRIRAEGYSILGQLEVHVRTKGNYYLQR